MRKGERTLLVLALITAFAAVGLFLPGPARAGELEPPAGPDEPASAMYTLEDIYDYLVTGVAGTKRGVGFVEPPANGEPVGMMHTLDDVHDKIGERCITCEGTLVGTRWCDMDADGDGTPDGTVKDMTTGLVWLKEAHWGGQRKFFIEGDILYEKNAHDRAAELWDDGVGHLHDGSTYGDWRLPTKNELQKFTSCTEAVGCWSIHPFEGVRFGRLYWSSTRHSTAYNLAWIGGITGGDGGGMDACLMHEEDVWVWPVRSGN